MRRLWYVISVVILGSAAFAVEIPLAVLEPGPTFPVSRLVDTEGLGDFSDSFVVTSADVGAVTTVGWVQAVISDQHSVAPRLSIVPPGVDADEFEERQRRMFEESVRVAAAVGLEAAGMEVVVEGEGVRVEGVVAGAPAASVLQEGDLIIGINGEPVSLVSELSARTGSAEPGDQLTLEIIRGSERRSVVVEVVQLSQLDRPGIGIFGSTAGQTIRLPVHVAPVADLEVAGPSAGLMLALGIYEAASGSDIARGRMIAGTGTVDPGGSVGPVGGVRQKVLAAARDGATVFLVPRVEEAEARRAAPSELRVIGVDSFTQALAALEE